MPIVSRNTSHLGGVSFGGQCLFGSIYLDEITPRRVKDYISMRIKKDRVKANSVNRHLQLLRKMFNWAVDMGYEVGENPVKSSLLFDESTFRRERVLSNQEEAKLLKEAAPHLRDILEFALGTGCRLKEIINLKIEDVSFQNGIITIQAENNKTKTVDAIPMNSMVRNLLKRVISENNGRSEHVFNFYNSKTGNYGPINSIKVAFKNACNRAGLEDFQFRDTRRTFSSRLHERGVDPLIVQRLLRHSSFKISEQVYIQSNLRMMKRAVEALDTKKASDCGTRVTSEAHPLESHLFSMN